MKEKSNTKPRTKSKKIESPYLGFQEKPKSDSVIRLINSLNTISTKINKINDLKSVDQSVASYALMMHNDLIGYAEELTSLYFLGVIIPSEYEFIKKHIGNMIKCMNSIYESKVKSEVIPNEVSF